MVSAMQMVIYAFVICLSLAILAVPVLGVARFTSAIFSSKIRQTIKTHWRSHVVLAAASLACIFLLLASMMPGWTGLFGAKRAKSENGAEQIRTAILAYETEYDEPPPNNQNAALIKTLTGSNPRGIMFLSVSPRDMNARGEMVDAWGQPFRVSLADPKHPVVFSTSLYTVPALAKFQDTRW
jgi:hypothetical protein